MNNFQPRYFMPVYLLLLSLGGLSLWSALRFARRRRLPSHLAFVGLAGLLLLVAGLRLPGPAGGGLRVWVGGIGVGDRQVRTASLSNCTPASPMEQAAELMLTADQPP